MDKIEICKCNIIHKDVVDKIKGKLPDIEESVRLAEFFKVFADTTRIRILTALFHAEMCVCDIAHLLEMTQPAISHQMKILKTARLVKYRKEGKVVYYSLDDSHIEDIFDAGINHTREKK